MNLESLNATSTPFALGAHFAVPTYYDILNVDPRATRFAIRESYLRLKNLYANGGDGLYGVVGADDLSRHLQELELAIEVLNDDARRASYDRGLAGGITSREVSKGHDAQGGSHEVLVASGTDVVQTSRSVLKVTRIRATASRDEKLQAAMLGILEECDVGDGSVLVALREAAGVSQAEVQERTKISLDYIRCMEANQFDRLPRVVYVKGFMRSYLRYLNVPQAEKIVTAYTARLEAYQSGQK